jgi:hypothetical protein
VASICVHCPSNLLSFSKYYPFEFCTEFLYQNINIELFAPECALNVQFWGKYYIKIFGPFVLSSFVAIGCLIQELAAQRNIIAKPKKSLYLRVTTAAAFILIALYTSSISVALTPFNCKKQPNGTYTLLKDPSIICYDEDWNQRLGVVVLAILCGPIAIPVGLFYIYFRNRKDHHSLNFLKTFDLLVSPYRPPYYYWELVVMLRRTFFVLSTDFLGGSSYAVRYSVSTVVLVTFFWIEAICLPYAGETLNILNVT